MENQVLFLHEEFSKQIAFPRKALETEFSYFTSALGREMHGTDVTHKLSWIQVSLLVLLVIYFMYNTGNSIFYYAQRQTHKSHIKTKSCFIPRKGRQILKKCTR